MLIRYFLLMNLYIYINLSKIKKYDMRQGLVLEYNVDKINVEAGLKELVKTGYTDVRTIMVIEYNLNRWAKGEEKAAQKGAIDKDYYGIDLTSWIRVLAAARAEIKG